ncbi:sugar ABC transporter permease [Nakamurella flavida]|uniref:Sugar ABC transporter permease n=1 Tax=Nakamurella flavida TaxID=363630 RepID=A0A938YFQ5_9ACTN|nr:sugar ABC transporter permease [Nakamurella flavida]MBM9476840.1 sugar ABC transporter permease [Nakamurella flavida]MDP9778718.1 multiple sugar transport system permease protein [Nakamurella flavida]
MTTVTAPPPVTHAPATLPGPGPRPRRGRAAAGLQGWLYALPTALFVGFLFIAPVLLVLRMSASDWKLFTGDNGWNLPVNFENVTSNRFFVSSILFTLQYTAIATVLLMVLGLGLALLVQESTRWKSFLRTAILVPSALGLASASLLFYALYSPQSSPFNPILRWLGVTDSSVSFLGTPSAALWSTVALIVWRFAGFYMLLLLVGLQRIPGDVYEAARIDGATWWQTFRGITLPLLKPSISLALILCVTGSLLAFDQFYILTKGGPDNSTITVVQLIYNQAFSGQNNLGRAAALSVIVLGALILINALQFKGLKSEDQ